jgi:hypothetical protein
MSVTGKAAALAEAMSDISEECWCAAWLMGCEYDLWRMLRDGSRNWGFGEVSEADVERLRELSAECGGWVYWAKGLGGSETFAPLDEWLIMFERHELRNRARAKHNEVTSAMAGSSVGNNSAPTSATNADRGLGHSDHDGKVRLDADR